MALAVNALVPTETVASQAVSSILAGPNDGLNWLLASSMGTPYSAAPQIGWKSELRA